MCLSDPHPRLIGTSMLYLLRSNPHLGDQELSHFLVRQGLCDVIPADMFSPGDTISLTISVPINIGQMIQTLYPYTSVRAITPVHETDTVCDVMIPLIVVRKTHHLHLKNDDNNTMQYRYAHAYAKAQDAYGEDLLIWLSRGEKPTWME